MLMKEMLVDANDNRRTSLRLLTLELPYPPVTGNQAVRHAGRGVHYKTEPAKAYERAVDSAVRLARLSGQIEPQALAGPLVVSWVLAPPDRRARDCDNVRKVVGDALTKAGLWSDDSNRVLVRELFEWTEPVIGGQILLTVEAAA
jgi:Holliday junction resolvase RusA-like endonuclease